eukprot:scaffold8418_cov106-Isochrysis_galbana.AAC.7
MAARWHQVLMDSASRDASSRRPSALRRSERTREATRASDLADSSPAPDMARTDGSCAPTCAQWGSERVWPGRRTGGSVEALGRGGKRTGAPGCWKRQMDLYTTPRRASPAPRAASTRPGTQFSRPRVSPSEAESSESSGASARTRAPTAKAWGVCKRSGAAGGEGLEVRPLSAAGLRSRARARRSLY